MTIIGPAKTQTKLERFCNAQMYISSTYLHSSNFDPNTGKEISKTKREGASRTTGRKGASTK